MAKRAWRRASWLWMAWAVAGCGAAVSGADAGGDAASDAAPPLDAPGDAPAPEAGGGPCALPNGAACARGQTCPAGDGCNTCACDANGALRCTERACVDAGPPSCRSNADCRGGEACTGPAGCAATWRCEPARDNCVGSIAYCGCDGRTFTAPRNCPGRQYLHEGACEGPAPDAGGPRGCTTTADCPPNAVCEGMGCGTPDGVCAPLERGCTEDLVAYCGCDGRTFSASSTCPGARFASRGPCP